VQSYHKEWYLATFFQSLFLSKPKLIDNTLKGKILRKFIHFVVKRCVKNLKNEFLPEGMTIVVVFKKR